MAGMMEGKVVVVTGSGGGNRELLIGLGLQDACWPRPAHGGKVEEGQEA